MLIAALGLLLLGAASFRYLHNNTPATDPAAPGVKVQKPSGPPTPKNREEAESPEFLRVLEERAWERGAYRESTVELQGPPVPKGRDRPPEEIERLLQERKRAAAESRNQYRDGPSRSPASDSRRFR